METSKNQPRPATDRKITSTNPATGETVAEFKAPSPKDVTDAYSRARDAQKKWAQLRPKKRGKYLLNLREAILNHMDELVELICKENGKPKFEALSNDVLPAISLLTFYGNHAGRMLKNKPVKIYNPLFLHRKSEYQYWPLGTVLVITPWNFPFMIPLCEVAAGLVAGNAVILKPSEVTPAIGQKIEELCAEAGFPPHLLQVIHGNGKVGQALIEARPNKVFFTGSVATGKKIMEACAKRLIPVNLELGGKDAMIVLADADADYAASAALWGGMSNSGQCCASTERLLLHESIAAKVIEKLREKIAQLRPGEDLGVITFDKQKEVYERQLKEARERGANFLAGGEFSDDKKRLVLTLIAGENIDNLEIFAEETFGPVIAITTFRSIEEAVQKANQTRYGLLASVITNNLSLGEEVARQLEVGTVCINEVAYTASVSETPWGGVKESGIGRSHAELGLMECVNIRHIHKPRFRIPAMKSLWWFPYTQFQYEAFRLMAQLFRKSWIRKARALPDFLWHLVHLIKREKRL